MEDLINSWRTGPDTDSYIKTKSPRFTLLSETLGMNRLTLILVLTMTVLLGSSGVCWSADLQKGFDALERGDYATALKEWTILAKHTPRREFYTHKPFYHSQRTERFHRPVNF